MTWISDSQLTAMRSQVANTLFGTCVISAPAFVSDGAGGGSVTYTAVSGGTVACRIDPMGARQENVGINWQQEVLKVKYQLTVPYDAPLAADYQVTSEGHTYEIMQLDIDQSKRVARRAIITEMRG